MVKHSTGSSSWDTIGLDFSTPIIASVQGPDEQAEGDLINFDDQHQNRPRMGRVMGAPQHVGHSFGMDADLAVQLSLEDNHRQHQVDIEY